MTTLTFALLVLVSALGNPSSQSVSGNGQIGRSDPADVFAIYLVTEPVDGRLIGYGKGDWSHLRLAPSPLVSADDIISYDFSKHAMRLQPAALARIPKAVPGTPGSLIHGVPFVVLARGQRVYLGVFVSPLSSVSFAVPSIYLEPQLLDPTLPKDVLIIGAPFPSISGDVRPDPRGDERVKTALAALHKLKSDR